jgi:phosphopantetheinyl transferase (holo-ACP synthase)
MVLQGCGIDSEKILRFERAACENGHPFPFVFSKAETDHCRRLSNPVQGFCAAFCCKEALRKAIGAPYNFTDCEALFDERGRTVSLRLAEGLKREACIGEVLADVITNPLDSGEMIVVVTVGRLQLAAGHLHYRKTRVKK